MTDFDDLNRQILDNLFDGVYFVDRKRRITYWNKGAERISGYAAGKVIGSRCMDMILMHVDEEGTLLCNTLCPLADTMLDGHPREVEIYLHHLDGHRVPVRVRASPIRDRQGRIIGGMETFSDNSAVLSTTQNAAELNELIFRDPLTGVGNRYQAETKIVTCLFQQDETNFPTGVLLINIDHFKQLNQRHGQELGDQVLRAVANTLAANIRPNDFLGRWSGDEFISLIPNISAEQLRRVADKLRILVARSSLFVGDSELTVTLSVGATLTRLDDTLESLVDRANELMLKSKVGGNQITFGA